MEHSQAVTAPQSAGLPTLDAGRAPIREDLLAFCENFGAVLWVYDLDERRIAYVNGSYERLWGRAVAELYADPRAWQAAVHPEDLEAVKAAVRRLSTGACDVTYRIVRPSGETRWIRTRSVSLVTGADGRRRVAGTSEDVTDAHRTEAALRGLAADLSTDGHGDYFQALVTHLASATGADHVIAGALDPRDPGLVRTVAMCTKGELAEGLDYRLEGTPCADVLGTEIYCHPRGVRTLYPDDPDLAALGIEGYMGVRLSSSTGEPLGLLVALFEEPIRDATFVRTLFLVCAERAGAELARRRADRMHEHANQDLERRVAERTRDLHAANERLRASEERYRLFVQKSSEGIWCLEVEQPVDTSLAPGDQLAPILETGRMVECNDVVAQRLGVPSADHLRGAPLRGLEGFWCEEYSSAVLRLLVEGLQITDVETFPVLSDGRRRHLSGTLVGVFEQRGLRRIWCTERDVTDRIAAEERAHLHQSRLAHFSRLNTVGEMASGIAHELNQPLAAIVNYTSGCIRHLEGSEDSVVRDALVSTRGQAERAGEIIRRLRRFVRRGEHRRAPCSLHEIVRETVGLLTPRIRQLRVRVALELFEGPDLVLADPIQIEQVLVNLVRNGYEAMEAAGVPEPRIVVATRPAEKGRLLAEVRDFGPGLSPAARHDAFQPFFSTRRDGVGLGLPISRSIVEAHGGHLWWVAPQGPGAAFRFTLPRAPDRENMQP